MCRIVLSCHEIPVTYSVPIHPAMNTFSLNSLHIDAFFAYSAVALAPKQKPYGLAFVVVLVCGPQFQEARTAQSGILKRKQFWIVVMTRHSQTPKSCIKNSVSTRGFAKTTSETTIRIRKCTARTASCNRRNEVVGNAQVAPSCGRRAVHTR